MTKTPKGHDPLYIIRAKIIARMLPPEPPADMMPAYLNVVKKLMCNSQDEAAQKAAQRLRQIEKNRLAGRVR